MAQSSKPVNHHRKRSWPHGAIVGGMAASFLTSATANLLAKDTVKSAVKGGVRKLLTGSLERPYQDIAAVDRCADLIVGILYEKQIFPNLIGIDGPPGAGKSTLGRSLAKRTGLYWRCLHLKDMREPYYFLPGRIYENIRLFRTQDIENFEVILYIDCRAGDAQRRVIERDRNGALSDYLDFEKMKKIGDAAFEMADGKEIKIPMNPVRMKLKPKDGYRDMDNLKTRLQSNGWKVEQFSKEELLSIYCYGKPESGILPYVKFGAYNSELLSAAYTALRMATLKNFLR
ncbi:MAG TPA: hypothetical protein HPP90_05310 [Deltaproteobacteria bacterium]|nr:hypothetical protein [Deltaproteobacteria bacterium]